MNQAGGITRDESAGFRKARLICLISFVGLLVGAATGITWLSFLSALAFVLSLIGSLLWRCPRCNKPFGLTWGVAMPLLDKCVHCGSELEK